MPLIISEDQAVVSNVSTITDAPAVRITAANVRFTNTELGRLNSNDPDVAAIVLEGNGATVLNELGGIIRGARDDVRFTNGIAILGSSGTDTIINYGLLSGKVSLGEGDDSFTQAGYYSTTSDKIDLGGGDDIFWVQNNQDSSSSIQIQDVAGRAGFDTLVLTGTIGLVRGGLATGFERLQVGADVVNIDGFSGFSEIVLESDASNNFINSINPNVDLTVSGFSFLTVGPGSVFRNIVGADGFQRVEIGAFVTGKGTILGNVDLAGGDDTFAFFWVAGSSAPTIGGTVDGGSGKNLLQLLVGENRTLDLSNFLNFQLIDAGGFTTGTSSIRLVNMNGYEKVWGDSDGSLTIADSYSPGADILPGFLGTLILEATVTVGNIGFYNPGDEKKAQGNDDLSFVVTNAGTVLGNVWLYIGDDLYDGSLGTVGGTVFGFAGNDKLYGSAGADRMDGGFGADLLVGGDGADLLIGGPGSDILEGGAGLDSMDGGAGVDTAVFAGSWQSYTFVNLGGGQISVTGADGAEILTGVERLQFADKLIAAPPGFLAHPEMTLPAFGASAAAGGWVNANLYPRLAADVSGDGKADLIGFGDGGVQIALAIGDGSFAAPFETLRAFGAGGGAGGWTNATLYPRLAADVNGDGKSDLIGFGDGGVQVALATDDGAFAAPFETLRAFGAGSGAGGWISGDRYPRAVADVNGDGMADLIGFGDGGVQVALATGGGAFATPFLSLAAFGAGASAGGWTGADRYPRTLADINGDGLADLIGFGDGGVLVALATGGGFFSNPYLALDTFGAGMGAGSWTSGGLYPRLAADVDGDGCADLVGFGDGGVYVAIADGSGGFAAPVLDLRTFGAGASAGSWTSSDLYPRMFADVDADGQVDLIAFGDGGVYIAIASEFAMIG